MNHGYDPEVWYRQIRIRRSVRCYDGRPVSEETLRVLGPLLSGFSALCRGARALVLREAGDLFTGIVGSLGAITGVRTVLAFVGDTGVPEHMEAVGYLGEGVILEATSLGLATCWVSGTFRRKDAERTVDLSPGERVVAVSPVGYAGDRETPGQRFLHIVAGSARRKPLEAIYEGLPPERWPSGLRDALEAARLAPSAVNRQPWLFHVAERCVTLLVHGGRAGYGSSRRLDCGIAMLHFEVAARAAGLEGRWEFAPPPAVARFVMK